MREFNVTIAETLERIIPVQAESEAEAIAIVEKQRRNGDIILSADDYTGVNFIVDKTPYIVEMTYGEMTKRFRNMEKNRQHTVGYIVFAADSFTAHYDEKARTYAVNSSNKAFQPNMGGYSIYGSCIDGSEHGVRLEQYMACEHGGKDGWQIERCYMMSDEIKRCDELTRKIQEQQR